MSLELSLPDDPLFVGDIYSQWFYVDSTAGIPLRSHFGIRHQVR